MAQMKAFAFIGFLAILFMSFGLADAAPTIQVSNVQAPTEVLETAGSFTFTFTLLYNGAGTNVEIKLADSVTPFGSVTFSNSSNFNNGDYRTITGTITGFSDKGGQSMKVVINASGLGGSRNDTHSFTVAIKDVALPSTCTAGVNGTLRIHNFYIDNLGERGDDEEWEALDEIEMEVEVKNFGLEDIRDVQVEMIIRDRSGNDVTDDFDLEDDSIDLGKINDGKKESAFFKIKELPADLDTSHYKIYVKVYSDGEEEFNCVDNSTDFNNGEYHEIEFVRDEDKAVILRDSDLDGKILASCGDNDVIVKFGVYNIGDEKEEKVLVNLFNRELGIDEFRVLSNLRSGKNKELTFLVDIPAGLEKSSYDLGILTYFDYDDDEDEDEPFSYDRNSEEDLDEDYEMRLEIVSCKAPEPTIDAKLASEVMVGKELSIRVEVKNNGEDGNFIISATNFESWAELVSVTPQTLGIEEGETGEVTITLLPTTSGPQTFSIAATSKGETTNQEVAVSIAKKTGLISGLSNTVSYAIMGILALVVLIFLTLIIKLSRRKAKPEF